ncbi:BAG domain-containing protein [Xylariaceae sp. FL0016]|nr:BAG domain-containing protein [Xylariaceae sp. FL0016]
MSRYGWTSSRGDGLSPYATQAGHDARITDNDYDYITTKDLEYSLEPPARTYDPHARQYPSETLEPDLLTILDETKLNKDVESQDKVKPEKFPAYSIGDGKLLVKDVRDRARLRIKGLKAVPDHRIELWYIPSDRGSKIRKLEEQDIPVRDFGVKNNSVLEVRISEDDSSSSAEEVVVVHDSRDERSKKKKTKHRKKKPKDQSNLDVPRQLDGGSGRTSPDPSRHPSRVPSPAVPSGPLEKLQAIRDHFDTELLPLCRDFITNPPKDTKRCEDEHRKLSETTMQHVILKLDEIDTGGDPDIRAKRKELVNYVQDILKEIDEKLPAGSRNSRF